MQNRLCQPGWVRTLLNGCIRKLVDDYDDHYDDEDDDFEDNDIILAEI